MQTSKEILDTFKTKFNEYTASLSLDSAKAIEILSYTGVAFVAGFLFKKFFKTAFLVAISFFAILFVLSYLGLISIDWVKLQAVTGVHTTDTISSVGSAVYSWAWANILATSGAIVGFIVGYSIG